jgi:hypothetical protein
MDRQTVSERWKAWLQELAQPQKDGTYILRPWSLSSATYQVDAATKNRWLGLVLAVACMLLAGAIAILMAESDETLSTARVAFLIFSIYGAVVIVQYLGTFVIFRHAQRVPKQRWQEPAIVAPRSQFSRRTWTTLAVICAIFVAFGIIALLAGSADDFWRAVQVIVVFGALFLSSLLQLLWPRVRTIKVMRTAPVALFVLWITLNSPLGYGRYMCSLS